MSADELARLKVSNLLLRIPGIYLAHKTYICPQVLADAIKFLPKKFLQHSAVIRAFDIRGFSPSPPSWLWAVKLHPKAERRRKEKRSSEYVASPKDGDRSKGNATIKGAPTTPRAKAAFGPPRGPVNQTFAFGDPRVALESKSIDSTFIIFKEQLR